VEPLIFYWTDFVAGNAAVDRNVILEAVTNIFVGYAVAIGTQKLMIKSKRKPCERSDIINRHDPDGGWSKVLRIALRYPTAPLTHRLFFPKKRIAEPVNAVNSWPADKVERWTIDRLIPYAAMLERILMSRSRKSRNRSTSGAGPIQFSWTIPV
jgi:hypothetical protein